MKNRRKQIYALALALVLCLAIAFVAFLQKSEAALVYDSVICTVVENKQDPNRNPEGVGFLAAEQVLTSATGSQTIPFEIGGDRPYYRIYVENTGSAVYNITLTDAAGNNQLTLSPHQLSAGVGAALTNEVAASGVRYLTVTSADGSALSGKISIQVEGNPMR